MGEGHFGSLGGPFEFLKFFDGLDVVEAMRAITALGGYGTRADLADYDVEASIAAAHRVSRLIHGFPGGAFTLLVTDPDGESFPADRYLYLAVAKGSASGMAAYGDLSEVADLTHVSNARPRDRVAARAAVAAAVRSILAGEQPWRPCLGVLAELGLVPQAGTPAASPGSAAGGRPHFSGGEG